MRIDENYTPDVLYMAVGVDEYELPICVRDSAISLAHNIGVEPWRLQQAFAKSKSGVVKPTYRDFKCMRIDSRTGEIIVGRLQKHLKS